MESTKELIEKLNLSDECTTIEAKKATNIHRSVLESVCAFANEPGLGGGNILLGVEREEFSLSPSYVVCGIDNPDKLQLDLSTQCADMFNQPIRPEIVVDNIGGKNVINVLYQNYRLLKSQSILNRKAYRKVLTGELVRVINVVQMMIYLFSLTKKTRWIAALSKIPTWMTSVKKQFNFTGI